MKIHIHNLYYLFISFSCYFIDYQIQKKYFKKLAILNSLIEQYRASILKRDIYRVKDYSIRLFAFISIFSKIFRNEKIKSEERCIITLISAFTPLFDDFIDSTSYSYIKFKNLIKSPFQFKPKNPKETFGFDLFKLAWNNIPKQKLEKLFPIFIKINLVQYKSKKQKYENTTIEDIEYLTQAKGGYSVLLSRYFCDEPITKNEYKVWYKFGSLIQLVDDIFDIKSDMLNGTYTLPNRYLTLFETEEKLTNYFNQITILLQKFKSPKKNKNKLIYRAFMFYIVAMGILYQYKTFQKKSGKSFNFMKLTKKQNEFQWWNIQNIIYILRIVLRSKIKLN